MDSRWFGPVRVTAGSRDDAVAAMIGAINDHRASVFAFCNAHTLNVARRDAAFADALAQATVFNDGIGLELASRMIYGRGFPSNLNGTDLTSRLLGSLRRPTRIFLIGSAGGVAERAATLIGARYPLAQIVGTQHGFFTGNEEPELAGRIRALDAELVLVGMGHPRQEIWAAQWRECTGSVICCIGAWLDFTAGVVVRAPVWVQRSHLEWAFRLAQEPRRLAYRYIVGNPDFLIAMFGEAIARRLGVRNRGQE